MLPTRPAPPRPARPPACLMDYACLLLQLLALLLLTGMTCWATCAWSSLPGTTATTWALLLTTATVWALLPATAYRHDMLDYLCMVLLLPGPSFLLLRAGMT